jgi:hypothetical protein
MIDSIVNAKDAVTRSLASAVNAKAGTILTRFTSMDDGVNLRMLSFPTTFSGRIWASARSVGAFVVTFRHFWAQSF